MLPGAIASTSTTRGRQRAKSMPAMHLGLGALHIDLEEVDAVRPASAHSAASVRTGLRIVVIVRAELAGARRVLAHGGGEAVQLVDHVELGLALGAAGEAAHRVVARAHMRVDVGERLLRLHDQPAPALEVEPERDVVGHRMAAADIHVGARRLAGEHEIEMVVLEVLRIGKLHHFACFGAGFGGQSSWSRVAAMSLKSAS